MSEYRYDAKGRVIRNGEFGAVICRVGAGTEFDGLDAVDALGRRIADALNVVLVIVPTIASSYWRLKMESKDINRATREADNLRKTQIVEEICESTYVCCIDSDFGCESDCQAVVAGAISRAVERGYEIGLKAATRKHVYWGAGEPDCPRDLKAPNGELHTLQCKVCGLYSPKSFCLGKEQG